MNRGAIARGFAGWLGPALAKVRLHAVEPRESPGGLLLMAKRRRWFSPWLIGPGNLYLRWLGSGVQVLGDRRWKARERAMYRQLLGFDCETDAQGWLILPRWPGVTLARHASDDRQPPEVRLRALSEATRALEALHQVKIPWPGDPHHGVGHGDATLRNINYDPSTGQAHWFDFDTIHSPEVPATSRLANDLRALLYSALEVLDDLPVLDIHDAVRGSYNNESPWDQLRGTLLRGPLHFNAFHFAQARPSLERRGELEGLILGNDPRQRYS